VALARLGSTTSGLTAEKADLARKTHGRNELATRKRAHPLSAFLRQFRSPLVYVLLAAAALKLAMGGYLDAGVIAFVLVLMASIGYYQEAKAEGAMDALMKMAGPRAKVRRGETVISVPATEVVPGDILILEAGDRISADARLLHASNLKVDESALTGESMPADKHPETIHMDTTVADRKNMVHMGTTATYGRATALVTSTGMNTEIGQIAAAIQQIQPDRTPLQRSIARLGNTLLVVVLAICTMLVGVGLYRGIPAVEIFLLAVAAMVSAIPEGLPAVVTIVLTIGMRLMARRGAIIRRLAAVETLGSAAVICSDKTGTLTMNQMTVKRVFADARWVDVSGEGYATVGGFSADGQMLSPMEDPLLGLHLRIGVLCNDAILSGKAGGASNVGDPTEGAMLVSAAKVGLDKQELENANPRLSEMPFQSEKQFMATLHAVEGRRVAYVKGAPERVVEMCSSIRGGAGVRDFDLIR